MWKDPARRRQLLKHEGVCVWKEAENGGHGKGAPRASPAPLQIVPCRLLPPMFSIHQHSPLLSRFFSASKNVSFLKLMPLDSQNCPSPLDLILTHCLIFSPSPHRSLSAPPRLVPRRAFKEGEAEELSGPSHFKALRGGAPTGLVPGLTTAAHSKLSPVLLGAMMAMQVARRQRGGHQSAWGQRRGGV